MIAAEQNKVDILARLVSEKYGLNILKMEKTKFGTADCFLIYSTDDIYFLKVYQNKYDKNQVLSEISICQLLLKEHISVSVYIEDLSGNYISDSPYGIFSLQKYISGITYDKFRVPDNIIFESAEILGEISSAIKNADYLKEDFPDDWIKNANSNADMVKLENIIHMAEQLPYQSYKNRIIDDCKWKLSVIPYLEAEREAFLQLTRRNSHGDYNPLQWICENESIKCVIDFGSCGNIPIIWELIRSYTYSSAECINGDSINIRKYVKYLNKFLNYDKLGEFDLKYGFAFYFFSLMSSCYGYKEYITDYQHGLTNPIINFAFWRTKMCRYLHKNANELDFEVGQKLTGLES